MVKVKEPRPGFWAEALKRVQARVPQLIQAAIKAANEPTGMTVMVYGDQAYLLVDAVLTERERQALLRLWPLYLAEHGTPRHKTRLRLSVDGAELVPVEP